MHALEREVAPVPSAAPTRIELTGLQEQFRFREALYPGARSHILTSVLEWRAPLEPARLRAAIARTLDAHPALRAAVVTEGERAFLQIAPRADAEILFEEAADAGFDGLDWVLPPQVCDAVAGRPFALDRAPLIRFRVYRFAVDRHAIVFGVHHIVADGFSVQIIARSMVEAYRAGGAATDALPVQLPARLGPPSDTAKDSKLAHLVRMLEGAPSRHELPGRRRADADVRGRGAVQAIAFAPETAAAVERLAAARGASVFAVCATAAAALLARVSGQAEILAGVPFTNRAAPGADGLVGLFANPLPLRFAINPEASFGAAVDQTRALLMRALFLEDVPFDQLIRRLNPEREAGQHPLFQIVFNHADCRRPVIEDHEIAAWLRPALTGGATFDIEFHFIEHEDGLAALVNCDAAVFDPRLVRLWAGYLTELLAAWARAPDAAVADAAFPAAPLPAQTDVSTPHPTIHAAILAQAARHPDRIAVCCGDACLTYGALARRVGALAARLRAAGAGPGSFVPVHLDRSVELIVAIAGVLTAGAAYVPIDANAPADRVRFIAGDVGARVAVADPALAGRFDGAGVEVLTLAVTGEASTPASPAMTGGEPAYVIYTSGSTGQPKGVIVTHRNVTRLFAATDAWFRFDETDIWTMFHSQAFDFSVWEIFGALCHGGTLIVVPQDVARAPETFLDLLHDQGVTVLNQTPSAFRQLLTAAQASPRGCRLPQLRFVIFGGEALNPAMLKPWFELAGDGAQLINMYGITETTVHVTYKPIERAHAEAPHASPIGIPIPDLTVRVLDARMRPLPPGVPGELFVGGAGVGAGYLNRPELTTARFLPDEDAREPGARLYRTGDLGIIDPDGEFEYLGRADSQIKLRGHRIEPGEIEAALLADPAVSGAAVRAVTDAGDEARLVAWLEVAAGALPAAEELRTLLARTLPAYMVPSDFVAVAKLPLTVSGKLDWARLPVPERGDTAAQARWEPPANAVEATLARMWEDMLGAPRIGRHDNFFSVGGDSIRAAQFVRAARLAGLAVSIADLFAHQTITALAEIAAAARPADLAMADLSFATLPPPPGTPGFEACYPLTALQALMIDRHCHDSRQPGEGIYHVQQCFRVTGPAASPDAFRAALQDLVDAQPILRTRLIAEPDGGLVQAIRREVEVAMPVTDLSGLDPAAREARLIAWRAEDRAHGFGIGADGPLVRFYWFQLAADCFAFTMSIHHAIDDGWGNQLFLQQLFERYDLHRRGGAVAKLAPAANIFREQVAIERQELEAAAGEAFWAGQALPPPLLAPHTAAAGACSVTRTLPAAAIAAARALARDLGVSFKSLLLQLWADALGGPVVGVVANGRGDRLSDPFGGLGLFWNMLPVRPADAGAGGALAARLIETHRRLGACEAHVAVPLPRIYALHGRPELFEATFNFVHFHNRFTPPPGSGFEIGLDWWHDRFHYPLNLLAALDPVNRSLTLHVESDGARWGEAVVAALLDDLESRLTRVGAGTRP